MSEEYQQQKVIPGDVAFELYDTFGFPFDLTTLIARERGLSVDQAGFEQKMAQQKERARAAAVADTGDWTTVNDEQTVVFVGYDQLATESPIAKYRAVSEKDKAYYQIVLNQTPFYPEGGGQVGDTGYLEANDEKISVIDSQTRE